MVVNLLLELICFKVLVIMNCLFPEVCGEGESTNSIVADCQSDSFSMELSGLTELTDSAETCRLTDSFYLQDSHVCTGFSKHA